MVKVRNVDILKNNNTHLLLSNNQLGDFENPKQSQQQ